eukprot:14733875-Alexandrium_andersonii.AAC.1
MSASLVGSEMCIRDSPLPSARQALARPPAHMPRRRPVARLRPGSASMSACLLYTSDAADDM